MSITVARPAAPLAVRAALAALLTDMHPQEYPPPRPGSLDLGALADADLILAAIAEQGWTLTPSLAIDTDL